MAARLMNMKCQNCGANLNLDLDHLMAYCPYCGEKLLVDIEQLGSVLIEKEKTKQKELEYNNKIKYEQVKNEEQRKNEEHEMKTSSKSLLFTIIMMLLVAIAGIAILYYGIELSHNF